MDAQLTEYIKQQQRYDATFMITVL